MLNYQMVQSVAFFERRIAIAAIALPTSRFHEVPRLIRRIDVCLESKPIGWQCQKMVDMVW